MRYGISTACLYPMESEKALELLLGYGYRHFEFFANAIEELRPPFLREFKKRADDAGADFSSVHPFTASMEGLLFFGDYPRRFREGIEFYKLFFEAAQYLGTRFLVLHGQKPTRAGTFPLPAEAYCERFRALNEAAKPFGVTVCQENVFGFRSQSAAFLREMAEILADEANFVFDVKQTVTAGQNTLEVLDAMGSRIRHVHLSDNDSHSSCLLPGKGSCDLPGILRRLSSYGFQGSVVAEVYRSSYEEPEEIREALAVLDALISPFRREKQEKNPLF